MGSVLPALVVVDAQERLMPAMSEKDGTLRKMAVLLSGARLLNWDVLATEQYPKGLGPTVPELKSLLPEDQKYIAKTSFSCFGEPVFRNELSRCARHVLVIAGVESHVCVYQTAMDARGAGYEVIVAADAVSSRDPRAREYALAQLRAEGIKVLPVETILFRYLRDARDPRFKAISALVR